MHFEALKLVPKDDFYSVNNFEKNLQKHVLKISEVAKMACVHILMAHSPIRKEDL